MGRKQLAPQQTRHKSSVPKRRCSLQGATTGHLGTSEEPDPSSSARGFALAFILNLALAFALASAMGGMSEKKRKTGGPVWSPLEKRRRSAPRQAQQGLCESPRRPSLSYGDHLWLKPQAVGRFFASGAGSGVQIWFKPKNITLPKQIPKRKLTLHWPSQKVMCSTARGKRGSHAAPKQA